MEWKKALDLKETDTLQNDKGEVLVISKVNSYELEDEIDTYNFEVEEFHTYFVGQHQVLTHNYCKVNQRNKEIQRGKHQKESSVLIFLNLKENKYMPILIKVVQ